MKLRNVIRGLRLLQEHTKQLQLKCIVTNKPYYDKQLKLIEKDIETVQAVINKRIENRP